MRRSFDAAFKIVIGLEGKATNDPRDPGGLTVYGLSKRYNPQVSMDMTLQAAKDTYLYKYWVPAHCDEYEFPYDIVLFDTSVNPIHGGIVTIMADKPENWQDFLLIRLRKYSEHSKDIYKNGHMNRILRLHAAIKALPNGNYLPT